MLENWEKRQEPQKALDLDGEREREISGGTPVSSLDSCVNGVTLSLRLRTQGEIALADSWRVESAEQEWKPGVQGGGEQGFWFGLERQWQWSWAEVVRLWVYFGGKAAIQTC